MKNTIQPENQIHQIISDQTGIYPSAIQHTSRLHEDLGMDSMDILSVGCSIENTFQIIIQDEEIRNAKTVGDLIQLTINKLNPVD